MNSSLRKGLVLVTVIGTMWIPGEQARAAEGDVQTLADSGIKLVQDAACRTGIEIAVAEHLTPMLEGEYFKVAFTDVDADTFLFVRSEPSRESEWVGKLYPGSASEVIGPVGEWTKVQSGTVTGYVYTKYIVTGEEAWEKASIIIEETGSDHIMDVMPCAESKEEEEVRLLEEQQAAEEEAKRQAAERAANASALGQQVVDYACQFIGNPYVWGGTSLTNGADCSGFVQSVYAHFGISLPRTTWDQELSGVGISYSEAVPGDLILYEGHVGIYIGDGQIVNAINPSKGIGIIPATCMSIKTVRRVL